MFGLEDACVFLRIVQIPAVIGRVKPEVKKMFFHSEESRK